MPTQDQATVRKGLQRRDPKRLSDKRVLAQKFFPNQLISYTDTCQHQERRKSSRRIRSERRH